MELSYLVAAIRKRPWLVAIGLVVGVLLGFLAVGETEARYEAQAVLLIQPTANAAGGTGVADANRYLQSQLSVLQSLDLAEQTATALGGKWTRDLVSESIRIEERVGTDIVDVFATDVDALTAQDLANTYVDIYKRDLDTRAKDQNQDEVDDLDNKLEVLRTNLTLLGQGIADERDKYVREFIAENQGLTAIPDYPPPAAAVSQVNYDTQLQQYQELLRTRADLEAAARTTVATEVVQRAIEPTVATSAPRTMLMIAGGFAGGIMGLLAAVVTARFSSRLVDEQQTSSIVGHTVVGSIDRQSELAVPLMDLLRSASYPALSVIDELCVRSDANARRPGFVTVVVVGTEQAAGATTIATAMAGQFARFGSNVLLIDADPRRAGVTEGFKAYADGGIPGLLASAAGGSLVEGRRASDGVRRGRNVITDTSVPEVAVLGRGDKAGSPSLRRSDVEPLIERALQLAPVVVVDAGAVLDAAATVELCRIADAVVLAVPERRQKVNQLEVVARQLARRQGELLPVHTQAKLHRDRLDTPVTVDAEQVTSDAPYVTTEVRA